MDKHFDRLSRLGSKHDLNFSSQEMLGQHVMALDGVNRKMVVLNTAGQEAGSYTLVDLNEVLRCSVIQQYGHIQHGELNKKPLERYLQRLLLRFELKQKREPIQIEFYQHLRNDISELDGLEAKARKWNTIIAKLKMPVNYP